MQDDAEKKGQSNKTLDNFDDVLENDVKLDDIKFSRVQGQDFDMGNRFAPVLGAKDPQTLKKQPQNLVRRGVLRH